MKRLIGPSTASAAAWWANNPNAIKADCIAITLPVGQTIYATDGQWDLTVPQSISPIGGNAVTFRATQWGRWSRGKITSEAGFKVNANEMTLTLVPQVGANYPGLNISALNAAVNHLYDGAYVQVWTVWMPLGQSTISITVPLQKPQGWP